MTLRGGSSPLWVNVWPGPDGRDHRLAALRRGDSRGAAARVPGGWVVMIPGATLWLAHALVVWHVEVLFWAVQVDRLSHLA